MKNKIGGLGNKWLLEEDEILKYIYGKVKIEHVLEMIPRHTYGSIHKRVKFLGLKGDPKLAQKKYTINKYFFSDLNTESCYWAGFIAADGCIGKGSSIHIGLSTKDEEQIVKFIQSVGYNGYIKRGRLINKNGSISYYSRVSVWSVPQWIEDLNLKFNITKRKSLTLKPPTCLNNQQSLSFIAGYLDGDGSIKLAYRKGRNGFCKIKPSRGQLEVSIVGTVEVLKWISSVVNNNIPKNNGADMISLANNHPIIRFHGERAYSILNLLYNNIEDKYLFMDRKWKYLKIVN